MHLRHRHRPHGRPLGGVQIHRVRVGHISRRENPTAAGALAISPDLIAIANWAIGAALGGLAAIFLVPITSLSSENLSLIVIPILAAAVVGGFSSFPITTIAGLALGIAQSEVTRYVSSPGWSTAVPFVFVTVILYLRGRSIAGKEEAFGRVPRLARGGCRRTSSGSPQSSVSSAFGSPYRSIGSWPCIRDALRHRSPVAGRGDGLCRPGLAGSDGDGRHRRADLGLALLATISPSCSPPSSGSWRRCRSER